MPISHNVPKSRRGTFDVPGFGTYDANRQKGHRVARNPWILATASTVALVGANEAHAAPAYTWTGFYIGVNGGVASHDATTRDLDGWGSQGIGNPAYVSPWFKSTKTKATFGGQAGYSWQMNYFVLGVEADINHVGASQTFIPPNILVNACGAFCIATATNELTWLATFRGRAGFAVDRFFIYGTGGVAVGQVSNSWGWDFGAPFRNAFSVSETKSGYVAGGGIEAMVTSNVSIRAEYLHVDLGTTRNAITGQPPCCLAAGTYASEFKNTADLGRVALSYRW